MFVPSTAGNPKNFIRNVVAPGAFKVLDCVYNPDREKKFNGYTLKTQPKVMLKNYRLKPSMGINYYMLSDLVASDFFISKDYGSQENIIGVLSIHFSISGSPDFLCEAGRNYYKY